MQYAISAGALVVRGGCLLLVHHQAADYDFWVPPGGRLQGDESILECAARETREETGLAVAPGRIVYVEEFVEQDLHFCKFWFFAEESGGELYFEGDVSDEERARLARLRSGDAHVIDARLVSQGGMRELAVYPRMLRDRFWEDLRRGFPETRYLGLQRIGDR